MAAFASREEDEHDAHWQRILADDTVVVRTILLAEEVAGNVVSWVHEEKRAVGYWISRRFWGRGVASKALALFVDEIPERPLYAYVAEHNAGSIRVLEKCGFKVTGSRRKPGDVEERVYVLKA